MKQLKAFTSPRWAKFANAVHRPQPLWKKSSPIWFKAVFALGASTTLVAFLPVMMFGVDSAQPLLFGISAMFWFVFFLAIVANELSRSDKRR